MYLLYREISNVVRILVYVCVLSRESKPCQFLGFHSFTVEVSFLLGCGTASSGDWVPDVSWQHGGLYVQESNFIILKICPLLGCYAESSDNPLPTFWDNVSVLSSRAKTLFLPSWISWHLKMGPMRCPETSVKDFQSTPHTTPEERRAHQHRGRSLKSFIINLGTQWRRVLGLRSAVLSSREG
jgi:hypothetical protein